MDDFEYSVEISNRDWNCFFQECEECNLLPPSLARVDDSGMSDIEDRGSAITDKALKSDLTPGGFLDPDRPIDGPPDCDGSPVDRYLSEYSIGGIHNVLSGSEEDIHLGSVNSFLERLRGLTQAERPIEPSRVGAGKAREPVQREEFYRDGPPANDSALPANIPDLNSLPARCGTATEKGATGATHANVNTNTTKRDEPCSEVTPDAAASKSLRETKTSARPELFISEEDWVVATDTEFGGQRPHPDNTPTPETGTCDRLDEVEGVEFLMDLTSLDKNPSVELPGTLEATVEDELEKAKKHCVLFPELEPRRQNNRTSQECSPSSSVKKRRRRKKRTGIDSAVSGRGREKRFSADRSDSEWEPCGWRRVVDLNVKRTENTDRSLVSLTTHSVISHKTADGRPPQHMTPTGNYVNPFSPTTPLGISRCQSLPERLNLLRSQMFANTLMSGLRCRTSRWPHGDNSEGRSSSPSGQTDNGVRPTRSRGGDGAPRLRPCSTLQLRQSPASNASPPLPVTVTLCAAGESRLAHERQNCDDGCFVIGEGEAEASGHLREASNVTHSLTGRGCENGKNPNLSAAKGASVTPSVSSGGRSNHPASGDDPGVGHFYTDSHTLSEAEPPQQPEIDHHKPVRPCCPTFGQANSPLCTVVMTGPDVRELSAQRHPQHKAGPSLVHNESQNHVASADPALDNSASSRGGSPRGSESLPRVNVDNTARRRKHHENVQETSRPDGFSLSGAAAERADSAAPRVVGVHSPDQAAESNHALDNIKEDNSGLSVSEEVLEGPSAIVPNGNCSALEERETCQGLSREPVTSHSNESTDMVPNNSPRSTVSPNRFVCPEVNRSRSPSTDDEGEGMAEPGRQTTSREICGQRRGTEGRSTSEAEPSQIQDMPDCRTSVFAMSSFWSEMEKLTINDILGLRMMNGSPEPASLTPLVEMEADDASNATDSGYFTHLDDPKPERSDGHLSRASSGSAETSPNPDAIMDNASLSERYLNPVSSGAGVYPENMTLISNTPKSLLSSMNNSSTQKHFGKMSKNISVHNLPALGCKPLSGVWKGPGFPRVTPEQELDLSADGEGSGRDSGTDSSPTPAVTEELSAESFRISLTDIFQYIFGEKQSKPSPPEKDHLNSYYTDGSSVPEMYDHFFSEFDSGSLFYPLAEAGDQPEIEPVPIFPYSRSTNTNLQFPEAYDYFFSSSSSDGSSVASDEEGEEEDCSPIRVVTRFSRKPSETRVCTDMYDDFFTDGDMRQNFFWKNTFSLRNVDLSGSIRQREESDPLTLTSPNRSIRVSGRTIQPIGALGDQDVPFPDLLLYNLEDRISKQLTQQLCRYDDLQTSLLNPRPGASLIPLRQSDMCLVCIAFASWVLKSANPQVGDAWKAVLLANVSALSAIRYLRKYVRVEASAEEQSADHSAHDGHSICKSGETYQC